MCVFLPCQGRGSDTSLVRSTGSDRPPFVRSYIGCGRLLSLPRSPAALWPFGSKDEISAEEPPARLDPRGRRRRRKVRETRHPPALRGGGRRSGSAHRHPADGLGDPGRARAVLPGRVQKIGAGEAFPLPIVSRDDAHLPANLEAIERATGVFMTGGDQSRLVAILAGSPALQAIHESLVGGGALAGTSAGASAFSATMITGGEAGMQLRRDGVDLAPGLGVITRLIIDQHFSQRKRLGRLLTAVAIEPSKLGVGHRRGHRHRLLRLGRDRGDRLGAGLRHRRQPRRRPRPLGVGSGQPVLSLRRFPARADGRRSVRRREAPADRRELALFL